MSPGHVGAAGGGVKYLMDHEGKVFNQAGKLNKAGFRFINIFIAQLINIIL